MNAAFVVAGLLVAIPVWLDWRRAVPGILLVVALQDLVRRVLPGQPFATLLAADAFLAVAYAAYLRDHLRSGRGLRPGRLAWAIGPFALLLVVLFVLDPWGPWVGLVGLHGYLWYAPLAWLVRDGLETPEQARRLLRGVALAAMALALLGALQLAFWDQIPPALRPLEGAVEERTFEYDATLGYQVALPSSVFGSHFRFANASLFAMLACVALAQMDPTRRGRALAWLGAAASGAAILVSGSRAAAVLALVALALWGARSAWRTPWIRSGRRVAAAAALGAAVLVVGAWALWDRVVFVALSVPHDLAAHARAFFGRALPLAFEVGRGLGVGLGLASQGVGQVPGGADALAWASARAWRIGYEYGLTKVIWETGTVGLVLFAVAAGGVGVAAWRALRASDPRLRPLARAGALYALLMFVAFQKGHQYLGDPVTLVLVWFSLGLVFMADRSSTAHPASRVERNRAINRAAWPDHEKAPWSRYEALVRKHAEGGRVVVDVGSGDVDAEGMWFRGVANAPTVVNTDELPRELGRNPGRAKLAARADRLPFADASVDVVLSRYAFEHMRDVRAPLVEIARVLKPGGALVFVTPHAHSYFAIASRATPLAFHRFVHRRLGSGEGADHLCPTYYRLNTPAKIAKAARDVGLEVATMDYMVGPPEYTKILPTPLHKLVVRHHLALERNPKLQARMAPVILGSLVKTGRRAK